jgi:hypothetical protein
MWVCLSETSTEGDICPSRKFSTGPDPSASGWRLNGTFQNDAHSATDPAEGSVADLDYGSAPAAGTAPGDDRSLVSRPRRLSQL